MLEMIISNRWQGLFRLAKRAYGPYKFQILNLAIFSFIGGLAEGVGINMLIPLFALIMGKGELGSDLITENLRKLFDLLHFSFDIRTLLLLIAVLFIFKSFVKILLDYLDIRITSDYEEKTRKILFANTLNANWPFLIKQKLGHLESLLLIDTRNSTILLMSLSDLIILGTNLVIYAVIALNVSFYISLGGLVLGATVFYGFKPLFRRIKNISSRFVKVNKAVAHLINENLIGMKTVKSQMAGEQVIGKGEYLFAEMKRYAVKTAIFKSLATSFIQPLSIIFICIVFVFLYQSPNFNIAVLGVIVYLVQKIFVYIEQIQKAFHTISSLLPFLTSILDYQAESGRSIEKIEGNRNFSFQRNIRVKDLSFAYDAKASVLNGIDFSIARGEMIGLIGPSGAGKTTMVDLFLRLFKPTGGQILMDDIPIDDINLGDWRKNVGYVSQDNFLMNDTVANNIKFYSDISDERVVEAAKDANIYDFIQSLPDKFQSVIGERGILLSGGQRQRIAIARVLARKPKLLILDEATSSLDNESEIQIQKVIENLKGKITVITIAHRLSTVKNCDRLLILGQGRISEQGKPQDLLADKNSYFYKVSNIRE